MVTQEQIMQLVNSCVKDLLDIAELSLPEEKFPIFRKVTLNKFGKSGLGKELERVFRSQER
jgi:hypothetical protein